MSSVPSSVKPVESIIDKDTEKQSSGHFKSLFDQYAEWFTPSTSAAIIESLSEIHSLQSNNDLSHLNHRIISLVYNQLAELIEKFILIGDTLSNDECILIKNCLQFIVNVLISACNIDFDNKNRKHDGDDVNNKDDASNLLIREILYREIIPLNDSFLKFIQCASLNTMENYQHIFSKLCEVLIQRNEMMILQLNFLKKDELSNLKHNRDNQLLFDTFAQYMTSSHGVSRYLEAVKRLNIRSTSECDSILLFNIFNLIINNILYTEQFRTIFCSNFWLPMYEHLLKGLLPTAAVIGEENDIYLKLNVIKYLITDLVNMQPTVERLFTLLQRPVENFALKDEYLSIIKMLLPWFSNPHILKGIWKNDMDNDYGTIPFEWDNNFDENTTKTLTITFVTWAILQLILFFINANSDCLTEVKHNTDMKEILLQFLNQIKNGNPIKLLVYNILAPLLDEKDIQNETSFTKEIITTLIDSIRNANQESTTGDMQVLLRLSDLITLLTTLKAFLQFNQLKADFVRNNGLELLMEVVMKKSWHKKMSQTSISSSVDESTMDCLDNFEIPLGKQFFRTNTKKATEEVHQLALECFFTMSFNAEAAQLLKSNQLFMNHIQKLAEDKNKTTNLGLKKAVDSILWKLEKENEFKKQQEDMTTSENTLFDFMISYSWGDKPLVHQIYNYLTQQYNYRVWLDENEMSGSLCQAMAQAIEKSEIILICMSETYKQSENCRNEAEYAHDRKKKFIPLKMREVELDDWLGFMVAGKLYINFEKNNFEKSMGLLIAEIERYQSAKGTTKQIARVKRTEPVANAPILQTASTTASSISNPLIRPNLISADYQQIPIVLWSKQHVRDFLLDEKLDTMILLTENMNGEELCVFSAQCNLQKQDWSMFDRLNNELGKRYQQTLPMSVYLRFLHQISKYLNKCTSF
ncbi:unnamed protein product [Rotaria sordida]|uniref:TIR domain-containing protein n=1 Tax=Rotaria sordida TaxID=392033 RepID=A0A813TVE7_9BILA|nr:unnamed protein product [Rotaria sordida]CAF0831902.1 unnamed protein product [Rotaria sordida]